MGRVTIDVDDEQLARVMARYRLGTPGAAVEFALQRVLETPKSTDEILQMFGAFPDFAPPPDSDPRLR